MPTRAHFWSRQVSYEQAVHYGSRINECYVPQKAVEYGQAWSGPPLMAAQLTSQRIETLPGLPLPFNFHGMQHPIDFVVSEKRCFDARQLLAQFDLSICSCSFDGTTFRIPHPHLSFTGKAMIEPRRHALMEHFANNFNPDFPAEHEGSCFKGSPHAAVFTASKANLYEIAHIKDPSFLPTRQLMDTVSTDCFSTMIDRAIAEGMVHDEYGLGGYADATPEMKKAGAYSRFHYLLFRRLQKYSSRGIEFVNCPTEQLASWLKVAESMNKFCGDPPF